MKKNFGKAAALLHCVLFRLLVLAVVALPAACGGGRDSRHLPPAAAERVPFRHARLLTVDQCDGYTLVRMKNPWDTAAILHTYVLIDRNVPEAKDLPDGTVVKVPLQNALVYSAVHTGVLTDLGADGAIGGVCNAPYLHDSDLRARVASGKVADCGPDLNPDLERVVQLRPDAVILSPYQNNDRYAKVAGLGIPVIECGDYMEMSPLARAEWIRFFGLLTGKPAEADSLFNVIEKNYTELKERAAKSSCARPKIIFDQQYGPTWDVPTRASTLGMLIEDAGGSNPFAGLRGTGSVALAPEKVLAMAGDADVWVVRYFEDGEKSLASLGADFPVNSRIRAFARRNVYGVNTHLTDYFEQVPFHPDRMLHDLMLMLHPELMAAKDTLLLFTKLK